MSSDAMAQVALLNQQLSALRTQIGALEEALNASEAKATESKTQVADLGRRLNVALAQRVQDLSRYRSDFFGRLRTILEGRADVRVVGDRFVFQSEVLFGAGEANISAEGKAELAKLAEAVKQLEAEIPDDVNWVLRIDGHTDSRPINTRAVPLELGAELGARHLGGQVSHRAGRIGPAPGARRLRRVLADRWRRQRRGLCAQPAHRVQADGVERRIVSSE